MEEESSLWKEMEKEEKSGVAFSGCQKKGNSSRPLQCPLPLRVSRLICVSSIVILYTVIKSLRHRGLGKFFSPGSKAGIQPKHANRLRLQLFALDNARSPLDMNAPGWTLHPLAGSLAGRWAVSVSGNWRLIFEFDGNDVVLVDYEDYH